MFPQPTELLLIGCLIESIWTPKSKSNTLTPKTNSQTYWPREISHVMTGIIFCVCLPLTRIKAKSKPMMNLVSRCSERNPDVLASTATGSPGKTRYESQIPLRSWTEQHLRTEKHVKDAYSSSYSEWNADEKWSSQEWKSGEVMEVRTVRRVNEQPPGLFAEHTDRFIVDDDDMDPDTVAESDMLLKSRSFLHRVNDRVRKVQDHSSKDATQDSNKHSLIWWMFFVFDITSICFHGKGILRKFTIHQKYKWQSHNETDVWHIWKVDSRTIRWDLRSEYNQLGRFFMETSIFDWWWRSHQSLAREGLCIFRFCVYALERWTKTHNQILSRKTSWRGSRVASQWNSSGIFSQDSPHSSSATKSKSSCQKWATSQKNLQDGSSSCRCSTTSHGDLKTRNRNAN